MFYTAKSGNQYTLFFLYPFFPSTYNTLLSILLVPIVSLVFSDTLDHNPVSGGFVTGTLYQMKWGRGVVCYLIDAMSLDSTKRPFRKFYTGNI